MAAAADALIGASGSGEGAAARLTLLLTSPRLAPGLLSRTAWQALDDAVGGVLARDLETGQAQALRDAGVPVERVGAALDAGPLDAGGWPAVAAELLTRAAAAPVVWVGSPDGDPGLADAIAAQVSRRDSAPVVEVLIGAWDTPGSRLLDAVAVMDRLRSPGGCPWDAEQTHASLVPFLVEETHEAVEALESGDREHIVEELGDVLLQVLFHARVGAEDPDGFDIDDVAAGLVTKLVSRHPHVFADAEASDAAAVESAWERLKAQEKPHRQHPLDGIPAGMPDLARAAKVASRLERAGQSGWLADQVRQAGADAAGPTAYGAALMEVVLRARADGVDPSAALRAFLRDLAADLEG